MRVFRPLLGHRHNARPSTLFPADRDAEPGPLRHPGESRGPVLFALRRVERKGMARCHPSPFPPCDLRKLRAQVRACLREAETSLRRRQGGKPSPPRERENGRRLALQPLSPRGEGGALLGARRVRGDSVRCVSDKAWRSSRSAPAPWRRNWRAQGQCPGSWVLDYRGSGDRCACPRCGARCDRSI